MIYKIIPYFTVPMSLSLLRLKYNKSSRLIADRHIRLFIRQHRINQHNEEEIVWFIFRLQKLVYKLDKYGETNWLLNSNEIKKRWNNIVHFLIKNTFLIDEANALLEDLHSYMQIEIRMRDNLLPNNIPISDYYELKICDVQLQRNIIRKKTDITHNIEYYRLWQLIDIVSELLDDLDDLKEDSHDYNCNRIVIMNHFKNKVSIQEEYLTYLIQLKSEFYFIINSQLDSSIKIDLTNLFESKFNDCNLKLNNIDFSIYKSKVISKINEKRKLFFTITRESKLENSITAV